MAMNPDFGGAARPLPPWRQKLAAFWRWWSGELVQVMPRGFASLGGAARVPHLALQDGDVVLVEPRLAQPQDARVALEGLDPARRRSAVRALLERAGESRSRARLCLGRRDALVRKVTMPAATEENLAQVLAFEMDRLTPFRPEEVYFDHRVVSRDAAAGTVLVQLAVARRDAVDSAVAALRELGVSVQGVAVTDEAPGASGLDLLPSEQRGDRETSRERMVKIVLALAVAGLFVAALVLPAWLKRERVVAILPAMGKAQSEAKATDALSQELERQVADYNFLLAKKHGTPPALAYIEEVSRLLPDNTWVQQMDLKTTGKTREVQITGETPSSSRLIEIFEQSSLLRNATTRGTVTRGSQPGTERFMIAAEARPRPAPEPQAVSDVAPAGAPKAAAPPAPAPPAAPPVPAKVEPVAPKAPPKAEPAKPAAKAPGK